METKHTPEILRSSFTPDGQRLFLEYDGDANQYRIFTRWYRVDCFGDVWNACDAFEAIEMMDGDLRHIGRLTKAEIKRVPRSHFVARPAMGRINYLINSIERRAAGLRPVRAGSKGAIENWVPARAAIAKAEGR